MGTLEFKFWKKLELKIIWEVETMKIKLYKLESWKLFEGVIFKNK